MSLLKRTSLLFCLFLFLFLCSCATGECQGCNQMKPTLQDDDLLTLVVALVGIIALSGIYVQIMHKVEDNTKRIKCKLSCGNINENFLKRKKGVKKGVKILSFLGWQIMLFFIAIFSLMIKIYQNSVISEIKIVECFIVIPFILSQIIHVFVFYNSYKKYLWFPLIFFRLKILRRLKCVKARNQCRKDKKKLDSFLNLYPN